VSRLRLVIDDDPVERDILERVLLLAGYRVAIGHVGPLVELGGYGFREGVAPAHG
jgi:CheY-like chemotaxis protein